MTKNGEKVAINRLTRKRPAMNDATLLKLRLLEYHPTHQGLIDAFNDLPALHQTIV